MKQYGFASAEVDVIGFFNSLIMPNWASASSPDFDIYLYNPSGTQIGSSLGTTRQETMAKSITVTGVYQLKVTSYIGSGAYFLDVSVGGSGISLYKDDG